MEREIVLSLCDVSTNMVKPWAEAGYLCYCVDINHAPGESVEQDNIIKVGADILEYLPPLARYKIVFGFPPCTDIAVSGASHFKRKGMKRLLHSLNLVERCRQLGEWAGAPYLIENPVSVISSYWRKPDHTFHPHEFAGYLPAEIQAKEAYTKKTCLWTGNGFVMPQTLSVEPQIKDYILTFSPGPSRQAERSLTPNGFARAVFEANQ